MSSAEGSVVLSQTVTKNLTDRTYDKRKQAALEIETLVRQLNETRNDVRIRAIINALVSDFINSPTAHARKGGLIGLAATGIGLMQDTVGYLDQLIPPVLKCFADQDSRVRYYACEALYNIAKVARNHMLTYFNEIFDGLCKLFADVDAEVKNGAQLLDRLIKDIVTECEEFNVTSFIPLLKERIRVINPYIRQLLVSWISVLDSIPDIDLLKFLPDFLTGLFNMLSDTNRDIRQAADACLAEFLREIKKAGVVDFGAMVTILVGQCTSKDKFCRLTALNWLHEFIVLGGNKLVAFYNSILGAILPCIADQEEEIRRAAEQTNVVFLLLVQETKSEFEFGPLVIILTQDMDNHWVPTRIASLNWVSMLLAKTPTKVFSHLPDIFPALLKRLSDPADEVVLMSLEVLSGISKHEAYFTTVLQNILRLFCDDRQLLEARGSLIIRQLSILMDAERIYRTFSNILETEENLEFCRQMVPALNLILLTAPELSDLRSILKQCVQTPNGKGLDVFQALFKSWCHCTVSTLSLCLLAQAYELASALVNKFAEMEITVSTLVQIDKLVQLIESPIFVNLRLQLLEPVTYPYLLKCLYGILMLLPQSKAFHTLKERLNSIHALSLLQVGSTVSDALGKKARSNSDSLDISPLLEQFNVIQMKHTIARKAAVKKTAAAAVAALRTNDFSLSAPLPSTRIP
eukprot:GILK01005338.1.p1 GENE.GILK01005338.1~~GILK01005338.1.p1  ORF type:complete len:691 (-),score=126.29 GILK01005338.1:140-2212(-)